MSTPTGEPGGQQPYGGQPYGGQQPGQYGAAGYPAGGGGGAQPAGPPKNGLGITALVLGIIAILSCWTVVGGVVLGLLAIIFGIIGLSRANKGVATNKGVAIAGLVTGALGLILAIVLVAVGAAAFFNSGGGDYVKCVQSAGQDQAQIQQCAQQYQQQIQQQSNS